MLHSTTRAIAFRSRERAVYAADTLMRLRPDQVRVLIFGQGRTGSTLLESLLGSTGHFATHGEILSCDEREVRRPLALMRGRAKLDRTRPSVSHVKIYHLTRDRRAPVDPHEFLASLNELGWRIVYLARDDILRHALSTLVAEARGDYHRFHDRDEELRIDVDPDNLRRLIEERRHFRDDEAYALDGLPHESVVYETDLADRDRHQETVDRLMTAFGLPRSAVRADTRKVNRFDPRALIRNYDAVDRIVAEEGLKW